MQKIDLIFTRDFCLCMADIWHGLLSEGLKAELGQGIDSQVARFNGRTSEYYRPTQEMEAFKQNLINKDLDNEVLSAKRFEEFRGNIELVAALLDKIATGDLAKKKEFFEESLRLCKLVYPYIPLANFLPRYREDFLKVHTDPEAEVVLKRWYDARLFSEGKFEAIDLYWRDMIGDFLEQFGVSRDYAHLVRFQELERLVADNEPPELEVLKSRQAGYILYKGELIVGQDFAEFLRDYDFEYPDLKVKEQVEIKGQVASVGGIVQGKVQTIMNLAEVANFQAGNILVTGMTVPDFLPAIKIAKAIVTDEGGITCHAAIVSREMKIPCVIGTKIASRVLKDGDLVEVDTNTGIIKKL